MSTPSLAQRLEQAISEIRVLSDIFQLPSISFGLIHRGEIVLRESIGCRDLDQRLPANPDTIYPISSCSKMFTSAAMGILVDEGKITWQDRISKHVPDFDPRGDCRIGAEADIIDLLRHSIGLTDPSGFSVGPRGCHLVGSASLVPLLNIMSTANAEGQRFNRHWMYSNANFSLAGEIIARTAGCEFPEFIRSRILQPLGMNRTVLTKDDITDANVTCQYTMLSDGTRRALPTNHWPFDESKLEFPGCGMGSSLNDMLTWCISVLDAEKQESPRNPLKQMARLRRGYWTRQPQDPGTSNQAAFGMGWIRMTLPTSMAGAWSGNTRSRKAPHSLHLKKILGLESEKRVMIGHTGGAIGGIATVWTFPETQSAVCTMVNMRALGDASDFAAQILIQALFDLQPRVDLLPWARKEAELNRTSIVDGLLRPWTENRQEDDEERSRLVYVGEYKWLEGLFTISIAVGDSGQLIVTFNNVEQTTCDMVCFKKDTYSLFTRDLDYWTAEWFPYRDYRETLLEFELNSDRKVSGLWWLWDSEEERAWFQRED
ncbi:beta-lactamase/transpeptidase-like protein [Aspergillus karnatakaensis]|uniref:serine hydrolase domain-containing protein n=1 Tax=Aspergillus karnatakaensis TaxID=1810916 RepID=UPI003CCDBBDD